MSDNLKQASKRVLTPIERFSEILFGVVMVMTFTCSISVAEAGREDIRTMLAGALGCNLAWGLIDGLLYFMNTLAERGRELVVLRRVRAAGEADEARRLIAEGLPPTLASVLQPEELDAMRGRIARQEEPPQRVPVTGDDLRGALGVFLLVFLSTFPLTIPFMVMHDAGRALRTSNAIAMVILFLSGFHLARYMGGRPWLLGACMVVVGALLVALTIALGG